MDKTYWREFYSRHKIGVEPSLFAKLVYKNYLLESINCDTNKYTKSNAPSLLELGCGNGRDSLYFANNGIDTTAIDQVREEIEYLNDYVASLLEKDKSSQKDTNTIDTNANAESLSQSKTQKTNIQNNPYFLCGDFTQLDSFGFQQQFDCIYSRFTLHSISKAQQDKTLADCLKYCKDGGILAIEVRGEKNSLCGKGKAVENEANAFIYDNHYRRFLNFTQTLQEIETLRFIDKGHSVLSDKSLSNTANTRIVDSVSLESETDSFESKRDFSFATQTQDDKILEFNNTDSQAEGFLSDFQGCEAFCAETSLEGCCTNKKQISLKSTKKPTLDIVAGGGGYKMPLLIALRFSMPEKIRALHHLMVKTTTLFALSQERSVVSLKAIFTLHLELISKLNLESRHRFINNSLFAPSTKPSRIAL